MIRTLLYLTLSAFIMIQCNTAPKEEEPFDTIARQELAAYIGLTQLDSNPVFSRGINHVFNDTLVGTSRDNKKYFYKSLAENGPVIFIDLVDPPRNIFHSSNYP